MTCPKDCDEDCGNYKCETQIGENFLICPKDCKTCGNGRCELDLAETHQNCEPDCDHRCGDKVCEIEHESAWSCPSDCIVAEGLCGNGICEPGEAAICNKDCIDDGRCDYGEANWSDDCGKIRVRRCEWTPMIIVSGVFALGPGMNLLRKRRREKDTQRADKT